MATKHCYCTSSHKSRLQLFLSPISLFFFSFFLSSQHSSFFDPLVFILLSWPASLPPFPPSPASLSLFFHRSSPFLPLLLFPFTHLYSLHYKAKRIWWLACALCPQTQLTPRIFSLCWIVPQNERQLKEPALRWCFHVWKRGGSVGPRSQVEHHGNCLFLASRSTCWHSWAKIDPEVD